jgi:hypothetical protein
MSSKSCLVYFCVSLKIQMATGSILADFLGSRIDRITFLISRSRCYLDIYFNSNAFFFSLLLADDHVGLLFSLSLIRRVTSWLIECTGNAIGSTYNSRSGFSSPASLLLYMYMSTVWLLQLDRQCRLFTWRFSFSLQIEFYTIVYLVYGFIACISSLFISKHFGIQIFRCYHLWAEFSLWF